MPRQSLGPEGPQSPGGYTDVTRLLWSRVLSAGTRKPWGLWDPSGGSPGAQGSTKGSLWKVLEVEVSSQVRGGEERLGRRQSK